MKILQSTTYSLCFTLLISLIISLSNTGFSQELGNGEKRIYIRIEIKGMACPYCAFGMEKELKKVAGVDKIEIELTTGMAYLSTPVNKKPPTKELVKIVTDAGFTIGEIQYSDAPFVH